MKLNSTHWIIAIVVAIAIAVSVIGCDSASGFGGGERIIPTRDTKDFSVRLNIVKERDIKLVCEQLGVQYESNGCNAFHSPQNFCDIYVMMPDSVSDTKKLEIIGHELLHCRYGEYHK